MAGFEQALQIGVVLSAKDMYSRLFSKAQSDLKRLSKSSATEAAKFEKNLRLGKSMMVAGGTMTVVGHGMSRVLDNVADKAMVLSQAEADVSTVLSDVRRKSEFTAKAVQISGQSMFTAAEVLHGAAYQLLSAGLTEDQALGLMSSVNKTAIGTLGDIGQMAQLYGSLMNTFGRTWGSDVQETGHRIADGLARTVKIAQTTGPELAMSLQYAVPAAQAANMSFEDMLATLAAFYQSGLKGERVGTAFRAMLREIPDMAKKLGIRTADASGKMRDLSEIMGELRKKYGETLTEVQRAELMKVLGDEASVAVIPLMKNAELLPELTKKIKQAGAAEEMYTARMAGGTAAMKALQNRTENYTAGLGEKLLPVMEKKQKILGDIVQLMNAMPLSQQAFGWALVGAEILKLSGPVVAAAGMWKLYHTQQQIALALQGKLNVATGAMPGAGGLRAAGTIFGQSLGVTATTAIASGVVAAVAIALPTILIASLAKGHDEVRMQRARDLALKEGKLTPKERVELQNAVDEFGGNLLDVKEQIREKLGQAAFASPRAMAREEATTRLVGSGRPWSMAPGRDIAPAPAYNTGGVAQTANVNVSVYLDGEQISGRVTTKVERNLRRQARGLP